MTQTLQLNDVDLHVFEAGQGSPLLFVHGFPLDHTMWQAQLDEFRRTHRVIAPDLRGFGQSEVTAGTVSMEQFADDLAAVLDGLHVAEPVTLCGLSMGGYIAWQFWKRHPHKLGGLILCDTRAIADDEEARKTRKQTAERVLQEGMNFLADSMPKKLYAPQTHEQQPELIAAAKRCMLGNDPTGVAAALSGMADRPDVTDWLSEIEVPTLVIVGEEDAIGGVVEMRAIAAAIPHASLEIIPQAGHMSPQEKPQAVNAKIRAFLG